tara:strand:+ start:119 stop:334 length:216 start_codon:yes stop_codon:yes gene_type:complete
VDVEVVFEGVSAASAPGIGRGSFLLGLFSSAKVTPSNFVIPTTGGSPFFTNSYIPEFQMSAVVMRERSRKS